MNPHLTIVRIHEQIKELRDIEKNAMRHAENSPRQNAMLGVHYEAKIAAYNKALSIIKMAAVGTVRLESEPVEYHDPSPRHGAQDVDKWSQLPMPEPSLLQRFVLWVSRLF